MRKPKPCIGILYAGVMLLFILDAKTVIASAADGITLCLKTVIPSLLPFIIISILITGSIPGEPISVLRPISRLCRIPAGAESVMLLGFLGGYPVGAQSIYQAYHLGGIQKEDAHRMLGFCNNAGPAFIFGMTCALFSSPVVPWVLWLLIVISSLLVAIILPGGAKGGCCVQEKKQITLIQAAESSIGIMAKICIWVIVFRVIIGILERWMFFAFTTEFQVTAGGLLELSNGCSLLFSLPSQGLRFLLCASFLSFGGLSVLFQTLSVTKELRIGFYFPGKVLQTMFSLLFAYIFQDFLFPVCERVRLPIAIPVCAVAVIMITSLFLRKNSRNPKLSVV